MSTLKRVHLGHFETDGHLVVTDPCYELTDEYIKRENVKKIQVKPGTYQAYVTYGSLKDPAFDWDRVPGNVRVSELRIIQVQYSGPKPSRFTKTGHNVGVDSGQAGFFNVKTFNVDSPTEVDLLNKRADFFRSCITEGWLTIRRNRKILKVRDKDELYTHMKKHFAETGTKGVFSPADEPFDADKETERWFQRELENAQRSIKEHRTRLRTGKFPSWYELKKSKEFYEIICDMTSGQHRAGVNTYGAVSHTGYGDGGYNLYASHQANHIVGLAIEYIPRKYFK